MTYSKEFEFAGVRFTQSITELGSDFSVETRSHTTGFRVLQMVHSESMLVGILSAQIAECKKHLFKDKYNFNYILHEHEFTKRAIG